MSNKLIGYDTKCNCNAKVPFVKNHPNDDGSNLWICQVCGGLWIPKKGVEVGK